MTEINLGVNLSLEERTILSSYCDLLLQYGTISSFPMSDQEKINQSNAIKKIINKLTPEEITELRSIQERAEMKTISEGLTDEEKAFIDEHCALLSKYGTISNFPMSDQEKFNQSDTLKNIIDKLTPEEIAKFNAFQNQAETAALMNGVEQNNGFGIK